MKLSLFVNSASSIQNLKCFTFKPLKACSAATVGFSFQLILPMTQFYCYDLRPGESFGAAFSGREKKPQLPQRAIVTADSIVNPNASRKHRHRLVHLDTEPEGIYKKKKCTGRSQSTVLYHLQLFSFNLTL